MVFFLILATLAATPMFAAAEVEQIKCTSQIGPNHLRGTSFTLYPIEGRSHVYRVEYIETVKPLLGLDPDQPDSPVYSDSSRDEAQGPSRIPPKRFLEATRDPRNHNLYHFPGGGFLLISVSHSPHPASSIIFAFPEFPADYAVIGRDCTFPEPAITIGR